MARQVTRVDPGQDEGNQLIGGFVKQGIEGVGAKYGPMGSIAGQAVGGLVGKDIAGGGQPASIPQELMPSMEGSGGATAVERRKQALKDADELQAGLAAAQKNPELYKTYGPALDSALKRAKGYGSMA